MRLERMRRVIVLAFWLAFFNTSAWAQDRVRVINRQSPILAADLVTPVRHVDAGAELIVIRQQENWIEVLLPGLNPRRDTGFIARANVGPLREAPVPRQPAAPQN